MSFFICQTCGTQFPESSAPPSECPICLDPRQYIGPNGQKWTTREDLARDHHSVRRELEPDLTGIGVEPEFAIGQRALFLETDEGNLLWDCLSIVDKATLDWMRTRGGIRAIAVSHPHFYGSMVDWANEFDAPILINEHEREHVMRPDSRIEFWSGQSKSLFGGLTLVRCGGHFHGSQVLHWPSGAGGAGCLFTGDTITVVPDTRWVSFMYSYPNIIPLPSETVNEIARAIEPFEFDRIYGGWWGRVVESDGKNAVLRSAKRYTDALAGRLPSARSQGLNR